ncbi:MAG: DUF5652 family protein [Patescibacteria group bacterium UBA2163]
MFGTETMWTLLFIALWTLPWKGYALWVAARNRHKWWFVAILVLNTVAILEIIYIFAVGRPALKEDVGTEETKPE